MRGSVVGDFFVGGGGISAIILVLRQYLIVILGMTPFHTWPAIIQFGVYFNMMGCKRRGTETEGGNGAERNEYK